MCVCVCVCVCILVKLTTKIEGDPKATFSLTTALSVREGVTPFPGLLHFTLDPYLIMLRNKRGTTN